MSRYQIRFLQIPPGFIKITLAQWLPYTLNIESSVRRTIMARDAIQFANQEMITLDTIDVMSKERKFVWEGGQM